MAKRKKAKSEPCWEKSGKLNHHHDYARSRGGRWNEENIFVWDVNAHRAFHFLFKNRTLLEAAEWLIYINEMNKAGVKVDILDGTEDNYFVQGS